MDSNDQMTGNASGVQNGSSDEEMNEEVDLEATGNENVQGLPSSGSGGAG